MYSSRPGDRIWTISSSQIEYGKKAKELRPQTADRICKQHMQIEYEHMIYVQCCMCMQLHTTAQNTSKQLAQCNFHHACSCMGFVLFSMLKETHTADYVGQSFPEVGWYGKACLFSLWTLVVKSAVRIWIGLDGFIPSLTSQPTPAAPHNRTKYQQTTCAMQFSPCVFLHSFSPVFHAERDTYSRLCWPKFSIRLVGTVKFVCFLCEFWWWKVQLEYG